MKNQQGFGVIVLLFIVAGVIVFGTLAAGVAVLLGKAPECPNQGSSSARSEDEIGNIIENGSVNIMDGEATTLAQKYIGGVIDDARVCFFGGQGHISGKMNLGSVSPSFYVSGGVDLTGSVPKATNLSIHLGSLPNIAPLSRMATDKVNSLVSENLSKFELKQKYTATFSNGSVIISKQ